MHMQSNGENDMPVCFNGKDKNPYKQRTFQKRLNEIQKFHE